MIPASGFHSQYCRKRRGGITDARKLPNARLCPARKPLKNAARISASFFENLREFGDAKGKSVGWRIGFARSRLRKPFRDSAETFGKELLVG